MPILPTSSLALLSQLGTAAEAAGSVISANVAGFLSALTERLSTETASKPAHAADSGVGIPKPVPGNRVAGRDLAVIRRQLDALIKKFRLAMGKVLTTAGLSSSEAISFSLDEQGNLRASDEHPDAQQINNLVADQKPLTDLFQAIEARYRLLGDSSQESTENTAEPFSLTIGA